MTQKTTRKIIVFDDEKCDGCGLCATACHEGAIEIIEGKARLVKESYCDGLGDCIGECPQGAITFETREAEAYDEEAVKKHLESRTGTKEEPSPGCPGRMAHTLSPRTCPSSGKKTSPNTLTTAPAVSQLRNWPTQLKLVPANAPYLKNADIVMASDCSPFAFANFHQTFLKGDGKVLLNACPKFDDAGFYLEKLTEMIRANKPRSIHVIRMEVPCCGGLARIVEKAIEEAAVNLACRVTTVSINGHILSDETVKHHFR